MVMEEDEGEGEKGHIHTKKSDEGDTLPIDLSRQNLDDQRREEKAEHPCPATKKDGNHQALSQYREGLFFSLPQ